MSDLNPGTITIKPNGPYRVEGGVPLEGPEGQPYELKPAYSLCRCGKSSNKPYCDRTHQECGFVGAETADPSLTSGLDGSPATAVASLIRVERDGPYEVVGAPRLTYSDGRICEASASYRTLPLRSFEEQTVLR